MRVEAAACGHTLGPIGRREVSNFPPARRPITVAKAMAIGMARRAGPNGETDPFGRASPPRKVYRRMATLEQNKAVVRRFMTEVLQGGNLDVVDEVLDPSYVNTSMGNVDRTGFKGMLGALKSAGLTFDVKDLVAEGDSVVARFTVTVTRSDPKTTAMGLVYYRVVNGKITIDEPLSSPDLGQLLAPFLSQTAHA